MDKIKEYLEKIIKKANDKGAYYSYGIEHRSTLDKPLYMINVVWTKAGLVPLRLTAYSKQELVDLLKEYHRKTKANTLHIKYHQNQIDANEASIKYHKNAIEAWKEEKVEALPSKTRGK